MSDNVLADLSDIELWNTQLTLHLNCGRNKATLRGNRRKFLCSLASLVEREFQRRGLPSPQPPYHTGAYKA